MSTFTYALSLSATKPRTQTFCLQALTKCGGREDIFYKVTKYSCKYSLPVKRKFMNVCKKLQPLQI